MKVWILTMVDDENGNTSKAFSSRGAAETWVNRQLNEGAAEWNDDNERPQFYAEELEVTFFLAEKTVDEE